MMLDCKETLNKVAEHNQVFLEWAPDDRGIRGTEEAEFARNASNKNFIGPGSAFRLMREVVRTAVHKRAGSRNRRAGQKQRR